MAKTLSSKTTRNTNPDAALFEMVERLAAIEVEINNVDKAIKCVKFSDVDRAQIDKLLRADRALSDEEIALHYRIADFEPRTRKGFTAWHRAIVESGVGLDGSDDFRHLACRVVRLAEQLGIANPPKIGRRALKADQLETAERIEGVWLRAAGQCAIAAAVR